MLVRICRADGKRLDRIVFIICDNGEGKGAGRGVIALIRCFYFGYRVGASIQSFCCNRAISLRCELYILGKFADICNVHKLARDIAPFIT